MDSDIPPVFFALVAVLLVFLFAMLSAFSETRAVRAMRHWPFRHGITVVRRSWPGPMRTSGAGLTPTGEYRVQGPTECLFVAQGWQSHLSWSFSGRMASPFQPKGRLVRKGGEYEVTGRLSLAASVGLPALMAWMGGCAFLGIREAPMMASVIFLAGVIGPVLLTWATLPREVARFEELWHEVSDEIRQG